LNSTIFLNVLVENLSVWRFNQFNTVFRDELSVHINVEQIIWISVEAMRVF